jgi:hypothetical protein
MSLLDTIRGAVKIADNVTKPLQATVSFKHWTGTDPFGVPTYSTAVPLLAIVDWARKLVRTPSGDLSVTRATVTFLDVVKLAAATGVTGIQNEDSITLPDGDTGPILDISGFIDAGTTQPIATEVMLG